jgi:hypothetical protein
MSACNPSGFTAVAGEKQFRTRQRDPSLLSACNRDESVGFLSVRPGSGGGFCNERSDSGVQTFHAFHDQRSAGVT